MRDAIALLNLAFLLFFVLQNWWLRRQRKGLMEHNASLEHQCKLRLMMHVFLKDALEKEVQPGVVNRAMVDATYRARAELQKHMEESE